MVKGSFWITRRETRGDREECGKCKRSWTRPAFFALFIPQNIPRGPFSAGCSKAAKGRFRTRPAPKRLVYFIRFCVRLHYAC